MNKTFPWTLVIPCSTFDIVLNLLISKIKYQIRTIEISFELNYEQATLTSESSFELFFKIQDKFLRLSCQQKFEFIP